MFTLTVDLADARIREGLRIAQVVLFSLRDRLERADIDLLVVVIPEKATVYSPFAGTGEYAQLPESFFKLAAFDAQVSLQFAEFLEAEHIEFIDVTDPLRDKAREGTPVFPETDDHHNNAAGYRVIALALADKLATN